MGVHLHWADPLSPDEPFPNESRARFESLDEALAQAAHDHNQGREITRIIDEDSTEDVLDRKQLAKLAKAAG